jgi:hypothetical protein
VTAPVDYPWLRRAVAVHAALRRLVLESDEASHSSIIGELLCLLTRFNFPLKKMEPESTWRGWSVGQFDMIWALYGSEEPRAWARKALVFIARHNGRLLLECVAEARKIVPSVAHEEAALICAEQNGQIRRCADGAYEAVPPPEDFSRRRLRHQNGPTLHRSQMQVFERCVELGELHYSGKASTLRIKPRCFPLLLGPTGVGKTHLGREVARALKAHFFPVTYGRWVPTGARGLPTMLAILEALEKHERLLLFYDEIDKLGGKVDCAWTRSVFNESFYALDGEFPLEEYLRNKRSGDKATSPKTPEVSRLFVIGCGTFQDLTKPQASTSVIGFGASRSEPTSREALLKRVRAAEAMPEELLARFHFEPLVLGYPTPDEIPELLRSHGLDELAARAGVNLNDVKIDFARGGMRVLEALASDWLLKIQRREREGLAHE